MFGGVGPGGAERTSLSLHLRRAEYQDAGRYTCVAHNALTGLTVRSQQAELDIIRECNVVHTDVGASKPCLQCCQLISNKYSQ